MNENISELLGEYISLCKEYKQTTSKLVPDIGLFNRITQVKSELLLAIATKAGYVDLEDVLI